MMSEKQSVGLYYRVGRQEVALTGYYKDNQSDDGPPLANLVGVEVNMLRLHFGYAVGRGRNRQETPGTA